MMSINPLYTDDLAVASETFESLKRIPGAWKGAQESKGLKVNVKRTKMMISTENVGETSE